MRHKSTTVKMEGKSYDLTVVCEGDIHDNAPRFQKHLLISDKMRFYCQTRLL